MSIYQTEEPFVAENFPKQSYTNTKSLDEEEVAYNNCNDYPTEEPFVSKKVPEKAPSDTKTLDRESEASAYPDRRDEE